MKAKKLTRTEDFISCSCTIKSYFVQNQAISFALINDVSQKNGLQVQSFLRWPKAVQSFALHIYNLQLQEDLDAASKRWRSNLFVLPRRLVKIQRKALVSQHSCKDDTKQSKQIVDSQAVIKREKTKFKLVRKTLLKSFEVKEHVVTFSKLVPKKLFLIQNIQNPCKPHYTIVRPLINCSRHTITMACILNSLPVYPDISNKKVRYSRNRIRKQVIPCLQFFFNPEVEKALLKFSEHN